MARKKPRKQARHSRKKPGMSEEKKDLLFKSIMALVAIIILGIFIAYSGRIFNLKDSGTVAEVNSQKITSDTLNKKYEMLVTPDYYDQVTKEMFLNQTVIPEALLLQEAGKQGISVTKDEAEKYVQGFLEQSGMTMDDFKAKLKEQDVTYDDFLDFYAERLTIVMLMNRTVNVDEPTEEDTRQFYDENKASFSLGNTTISYEDAKEQIASVILSERQQQAIDEYVTELRNGADITIYPENIPGASLKLMGSFTDTGDDICYEDGKPVIRMFSTSTCPHCKWIKNTFDSIAREYADNGLIAAYHWELDTSDNLLTPEKESIVPAGELEILRKYDPAGGVPMFVFGCKYVRVGNAFETDNDLVSEERELRAVIDSLLSQAPMTEENVTE